MTNDGVTNNDVANCLNANNVQQQICQLVTETINNKYNAEKSRFENIVKDTSDGIVKNLQAQMLGVINEAFNAKLDKFSKEVVDNMSSNDLIAMIIGDLGLKFRDAIDGGFDNPSIEYYAKFIKYMESLKNDKLGITEVDEAINAIEAAIEAAEKAAAEKAADKATNAATQATEKAKKAATQATEKAKNAAEKAKKEAGKNATAEVETAAAAAEEVTKAEAADLDTLKGKLEALKAALEELKAKLGTTSGGRKKQVKTKTIKNKTIKKKQVKTKTKTKTKKKKQVKTKPKTKTKTQTKRKHT